MDRAKIKAMRVDIFEALKAVEQKHGVKFDAHASIRFGNDDMRMRLSCQEIGIGNANPISKSSNDYDRLSKMYKDVPKVGDWVSGGKYKVTGYRETSQYLWILIESKRGAKYKMKLEDINPSAPLFANVPSNVSPFGTSAPFGNPENRFQGLSPEAKTKFEELEFRLSPENLTCDGECSASQVRVKHADIMRKWRSLEKQYGVRIEPYI